MQWTREERSFCVEAYFSNAQSIIAVQRAFRLRFAVPPRGRVPGRQSIVNWVNAFRTAGNVSCLRRGPERRITTPQNIERVRAAVLQSPKLSARKQSVALGISRRSLHRILHDELNYVSKHHNSTMDADDSDYDQEGEIGDEEEQNYDSSNNLGVAIKIEPGLGDEDSISEDFPIKEEVRDPLDDMLDIDVSTSIKQENDYIDQNCAITEIRIKTEPNFSDDDIHDDSSQNYSKDSNEGCSQAELQKAVNADKDQEINNVGTVSKNTNGRDENQVFGDFIAGELRNLKSEENRKKLKSIIQNVMNEMSGTQE